jgi:hypothetical protein
VTARTFGSENSRWFVTVDGRWDMINRPALSLMWIENDEPAVALSWGNQICDPVWMVDVSVKLPPRLARLVDRHYTAKAERQRRKERTGGQTT